MTEIERELSEKASLEDLQAHVKGIREELYQIGKIVEHPGWIVFSHFVKLNAANLRGATATPIRGVEDALEKNVNIGIAIGLERIVSLLEDIKSSYRFAIQQLEVKIKEIEDGRPSYNPDNDASGIGTEPELAFADDPNAVSDNEFAP